VGWESDPAYAVGCDGIMRGRDKMSDGGSNGLSGGGSDMAAHEDE
jgi:hypothetical protein